MTRASLAVVVTAVVVVAAGCQIASEDESFGHPVVAERSSVEPSADPLTLADVDFDNALYASVCGLSWIEVGAGVGEGPSLDGTYGVEVVDAMVGDFDGEPGDEAVVLVDCLGHDTYSPHVIGFRQEDLTDSGIGPPVLLPSTGGSLLAGHRPLAIESRAGGALAVELDGADGTVEQDLEWAAHVISGAELPALPGSEVHGVIMAHEEGGALVVSPAPGFGYRLETPEGLAAIDPDTATALTPSEMVGRPAKVALDSNGAVAAVELLPLGAA